MREEERGMLTRFDIVARRMIVRAESDADTKVKPAGGKWDVLTGNPLPLHVRAHP